MRVIVCGSPQWSYPKIVGGKIVKLLRKTKMERRYLLIIHGGEPGPEQTAQEICTQLGIDQVIYPATRALGGKAWYRRNQVMIQEHNPDLVIAFVHDIKHNPVIEDMLKRSEACGIETKLIDWTYINTRPSSDVEVRPVYLGR